MNYFTYLMNCQSVISIKWILCQISIKFDIINWINHLSFCRLHFSGGSCFLEVLSYGRLHMINLLQKFCQEKLQKWGHNLYMNFWEASFYKKFLVYLKKWNINRFTWFKLLKATKYYIKIRSICKLYSSWVWILETKRKVYDFPQVTKDSCCLTSAGWFLCFF